MLVAISTSGNSDNLLEALKSSRRLGVKTIALLGKDGGEAKELADLVIVVPSYSTARVQEVQITVGHILCDLIEKELEID